MKIAIISTMDESPWGGSEELWGQMAASALSSSHQVLALIPKWTPRSNKIQKLEKAGLHIAEWPEKGTTSQHNLTLHRNEWYPYQSLNEFLPDAICISHGGLLDLVNGHLLLANYILNHKIPYTVVIQANTELYQPNDLQRSVLKSYFDNAHKVLFVSKQNLQVAKRQLVSDLSNGYVINNPVNMKGIDSVPWPDNYIPQFACVARLDTTCKAQDVLLEVFSQEKWKSREWKLNLFGKGKHENFLKALAKHYQLDNRLSWGFTNDIRNIWKDNHILVLPSRIEGTPLVLMEAMLCGRPSIVADAGGNFEWVRDGQEGFLAQSSSPRHIDEALENAWQQKSRWAEIGNNARTFFLENHDKSPGDTLLACIVRSSIPITHYPSIKKKHRISIIVPCYNQAHLLPQTIESIINQTYKYWECIIVNDGSTDNTNAVAQSLVQKYSNLNFKIINKKNGGVAQARNIGIHNSTSEWILLLDSDDIIHPTYLEKAIHKINSNNKINLITFDLQSFDQSNIVWTPDPYTQQTLLTKNTFIIASIFKKNLWEQSGGFFEGLPWQVEDWNFWIDLSRYGLNPVKIHEKLFYYRVTSGSAFNQLKPYFHEAEALIKSLHPDLYEHNHVKSALHTLRKMSDATFERIIHISKKHPRLALPHLWIGLRMENFSVRLAQNHFKAARTLIDTPNGAVKTIISQFL